MKGKFSFNISVLWIVIMFTFGLAILLIAPKGELLSETENRMLTAMPEANAETFLSGEFSQDFELFMTDKFFGRDSIVNLASECRAIFSVLDFDDMLAFGDGVEDTFVDNTLTDDENDSTVSDLVNSPTQSESDTSETLVGEDNNVSNETVSFPSTLSYRLYKANGRYDVLYNVPKEDVAETARIVNDFAELIPSGGHVYFINVLQAWKVNRYTKATDTYMYWGDNVDAYMQSIVNDNVTVFPFTKIFNDPIQRGEYVFFRTDSHWTPLGAHYAYSEMMKSQGIEPIPYDAFKSESLDGFLGAYYDIYKTTAIKNQADRLDVLYPIVPTKHYQMTAKDTYKEIPLINKSKGVVHAVYLGGNLGPVTVLRSEAGTGRNALFIKDSYGLIPAVFLSAHYDNFYMIDPRYFKKDQVGHSVPELIEMYGVDDIYFVISDINGHGKDFITKYADRLV